MGGEGDKKMKATGDEEHGKDRPRSVVVTSNYEDVD
jgi:hypothetical protein